MALKLSDLAKMDARAWRSLVVSFVLFGGVGVVVVFGASLLGVKGPAAVQAWLGAGVHGPWALPAAILGFTGLAFLGVPQFVLIAAAVVAFGPWLGFGYSWIGNLVSSVMGFYVGRRVGARALRRHAGPGVADLLDMIGRNGFWASLAVRLVPSAPFIVVNMAAGVTSMRVVDFIAGTAIGSVPKIALTAFAGDTVLRAMHGGGVWRWLSLAVIVAAWIGAAWLLRRWMQRRAAAQATTRCPTTGDPTTSGLTGALEPPPLQGDPGRALNRVRSSGLPLE